VQCSQPWLVLGWQAVSRAFWRRRAVCGAAPPSSKAPSASLRERCAPLDYHPEQCTTVSPTTLTYPSHRSRPPSHLKIGASARSRGKRGCCRMLTDARVPDHPPRSARAGRPWSTRVVTEPHRTRHRTGAAREPQTPIAPGQPESRWHGARFGEDRTALAATSAGAGGRRPGPATASSTPSLSPPP
jgi:hypothetical protein